MSSALKVWEKLYLSSLCSCKQFRIGGEIQKDVKVKYVYIQVNTDCWNALYACYSFGTWTFSLKVKSACISVLKFAENMECKTQKEGRELYALSCGRNHYGEKPNRGCTEWTSNNPDPVCCRYLPHSLPCWAIGERKNSMNSAATVQL